MTDGGPPTRDWVIRVMEDSALDDELVAMVEESIAALAPSVQQSCDQHYICEALQSLGCIRVSDLQLLVSGDILIMQAVLAPTPIMFVMTLKKLALASASSVPSAGSATAAAASPAPGSGYAFHTPTGTAGSAPMLEPSKAVPWPLLAKFTIGSCAALPRLHRRPLDSAPCLPPSRSSSSSRTHEWRAHCPHPPSA